MYILGIETSCDETAAAIVKDGVEIISESLASSASLHEKTGGVVPEVAARKQLEFINLVIDDCIKKSALSFSDIDAVAVTVGPGLIGSLVVGVEAAKALALALGKPVVPVNHLVAHIYGNFVDPFIIPTSSVIPAPSVVIPANAGIQLAELGTDYKLDSRLRGNDTSHVIAREKSPLSAGSRSAGQSSAKRVPPTFPAIVLIVSGGHTDLVLMKNHGEFEYLGGTLDDAAGEAFDKVARLLGLSKYLGGVEVSKAARLWSSANSSFKFKRPMIDSKDFNFSFSGIKTAVFSKVKEMGEKLSRDFINEVSYEFQEAVTDVLVLKTIEVAKKYEVKTIMLAGGVSANEVLRRKIKDGVIPANVCHPARNDTDGNDNTQVFVPPLNLCGDNAVCTASCAFFNYKPTPFEKVLADPSLGLQNAVI